MRNQQLLSVLRGLCRRLDGDVSLAGVARGAGRSRYHLHRAFRSAFGETPKQFVQRLRLERAAARLASSTQSILAIALEAGFSSHEVFTRAFRRRFSCAPGRYRASALTGASAFERVQHMAHTVAIGPCIRLFHLPSSPLSPPSRKSIMATVSITRVQLTAQPILLI
ncbi:MAG: helix-turn-helix transcriptional regulator, partial [Steroidobacteraceae bacterium]